MYLDSIARQQRESATTDRYSVSSDLQGRPPSTTQRSIIDISFWLCVVVATQTTAIVILSVFPPSHLALLCLIYAFVGSALLGHFLQRI